MTEFPETYYKSFARCVDKILNPAPDYIKCKADFCPIHREPMSLLVGGKYVLETRRACDGCEGNGGEVEIQIKDVEESK